MITFSKRQVFIVDFHIHIMRHDETQIS